MSLFEVIEQFVVHNTVFTGSVLAIILLQLIEIAPIKLSPWSALRQWIGRLLTAELKSNLDVLSNDIEKLDKKLDQHIQETIITETRARRSLIIRSASEISNGHICNEEHLKFLVGECDAYKTYCEENNINNGIANTNMSIIYQAYEAVLLNKVHLENDN